MHMDISAFDLDKTLLIDNSSYRFGLSLCRKKYLPYKSLAFILSCQLKYSIGLLSIENLHKSAFNNLFCNRSSLLFKQWAIDFVEEQLDSLLYLPAIEKLKAIQKAGHLTAILSSSPDFIVGPIAQKLNVPIWHATEYSVDKDQNFCQILRLMLGEDKALILEKLSRQHGIKKENLHAYSDSHLDLPFLMAAGSAFGVQPNRKLRSICRLKNWPII
jgi:HAD superfamily phosphoserine phosphatase-like hydrolase